MEMFNKVKSAHLKNEILARISDGNGNFEDYYAEKVLSDNADDVAEINDVLVAVYKEMDETVIRSFSTERFSYIKIISFINQFSKNLGGCGYVFTLNQDLLVERLFVDYLKLKKFSIPGGWGGELQGALLPHYGPVDTPFYKYHLSDTRASLDSLSSDNLSEADILSWRLKHGATYEQKTRRIPCLVKVHGTYYWTKDREKERLWGIGQNKLEQLKKEPLLRLQYEKFEETLTINTPDFIYVIGYSFCDAHINKVISEACMKGAKLIIFDVLELKFFLHKIKSAFEQIDKAFDYAWLYRYTNKSFLDLFPLCEATPTLFDGDSNQSLDAINNIPCLLVKE